MRFGEGFRTPFIVNSEKIKSSDSFIEDGGSLWLSENEFEDASERIKAFKNIAASKSKLYILPRIPYSPKFPGDSYERYEEKMRAVYESAGIVGFCPTCAVVRSSETEQEYENELNGDNKCDCPEFTISRSNFSNKEYCENSGKKNDIGCDAYIMEGATSFENDPVRFYRAFQNVRQSVPFDAAVWLPNMATPENIAMLVYIGADIFDTTKAVVAAHSDKYMTRSGTYNLTDISNFPCSCPVCYGKSVKDVLDYDKKRRFSFLYTHNTLALDAELRLVAQKIHDGVLREYVEGQCRTQTWLTGLLRMYDADLKKMRVSPAYRSSVILATTAESQSRSEIKTYAQRIRERYTAPEKDILVIFPCSSKKPYSISNSHQNFIRAMGRNRAYVNEIIITSPLGLIPRELELTYPAAHYDTTVTGHWSLDERAWTQAQLKDYLLKYKYKHIIAHVEGPYAKICKSVSEELNIPFEFTVKKHPASHESCQSLRTALDRIVKAPENKNQDKKCTLRRRSSETGKADQCRAIAKYQFGSIADALFSDEWFIKANFPKYQIYSGRERIKQNEQKKQPEQLATLVPKYGLFSLTVYGAEKIVGHQEYAGQYTVFIDDFIPKGSLLAPGVRQADPHIRPGDEVIVLGRRVIGVGKAMIAGCEMKDATKGVCVYLRHTKERNGTVSENPIGLL